MTRTALRIKLTFNDLDTRDALKYWYENQYNNWFAVQKSIETADDVDNSKYSFTATSLLLDETECDEVFAYMSLSGGITDTELDAFYVHDESTAWTYECPNDVIDEDSIEEVYNQWEAP